MSNSYNFSDLQASFPQIDIESLWNEAFNEAKGTGVEDQLVNRLAMSLFQAMLRKRVSNQEVEVERKSEEEEDEDTGSVQPPGGMAVPGNALAAAVAPKQAPVAEEALGRQFDLPPAYNNEAAAASAAAPAASPVVKRGVDSLGRKYEIVGGDTFYPQEVGKVYVPEWLQGAKAFRNRTGAAAAPEHGVSGKVPTGGEVYVSKRSQFSEVLNPWTREKESGSSACTIGALALAALVFEENGYRGALGNPFENRSAAAVQAYFRFKHDKQINGSNQLNSIDALEAFNKSDLNTLNFEIQQGAQNPLLQGLIPHIVGGEEIASALLEIDSSQQLKPISFKELLKALEVGGDKIAVVTTMGRSLGVVYKNKNFYIVDTHKMDENPLSKTDNGASLGAFDSATRAAQYIEGYLFKSQLVIRNQAAGQGLHQQSYLNYDVTVFAPSKNN